MSISEICLWKHTLAQAPLVEFKLSSLKSNISHPGLVLYMHIHGWCVHWHTTKLQPRATAQPYWAAAQLTLIHAWIDTNLFLEPPFMAEEWDETTPFHKALSSTSHSLRQECTQSFIQGSHDNMLLCLLSILQCLFITLTHFLYYIVYSHTSIGNASELGARHAWFLIFWSSFLTSISEIHLCKHALAQALLALVLAHNYVIISMYFWFYMM